MKISPYISAPLFCILSIFLSSSQSHFNTAWKVEDAFPILKFESPVDLVTVPDGSNRLIVLEQRGVVRIFANSPKTSSSTVLLDIRRKVSYGGEAGLLGIAMHPKFNENSFFFLNYTRKTGNGLETAIVRYQMNPGTDKLLPESETILLTFSQPFDNHNGGSLQFGKDGFLYIGVGDGGSWGDPSNNGQNKKVLLGKILRIDVDGKSKGNYGIPVDNPFPKSEDGAPEVYAYGLRNPWRMSFDSQTGDLWVGDVGQNKREEINIVANGGNYGWRLKESIDCYKPGRNCEIPGLIDPVLDLPQANGEHSVTGGFVYRGKKWPELQGKYIFADYLSGRIFGLETMNSKAVKNEVLVEGVHSISSFGTDENLELYLCNHSTGKILTLTK